MWATTSTRDYEVLRHAIVGRGLEAGREELAFVYLSRWKWSDTTAEYCVEYIDGVGGDLRDDRCFRDEAAAAYANEEFSLRADDWRKGAPPRRA